MSAAAMAVVPRGLGEAELIEIERLFTKLEVAAGIASREGRNIRMTPERATEVLAATERLIEEIRELWASDSEEPEADL